MVGPKRSFKALLKAKLAPKNGHSHCLVVYCQSDPLQFPKRQQNHSIWEVCSANQWDALKAAMPAAGVGQQNGPSSSPWQHPTAHHTTNAAEIKPVELWSLALSAVFSWLHTNWLPLLQAPQQLFAGTTLPQPVRSRKCFPRVHWIPKHRFLCYRHKQIYFSLAKMCWLWWFLFWLIKIYLNLVMNLVIMI